MADINADSPQNKGVYQRWNIHHRIVHFEFYAGVLISFIAWFLPMGFGKLH